MRPPTKGVLSGPDYNSGDAIHYLRWETALDEKYATWQTTVFSAEGEC